MKIKTSGNMSLLRLNRNSDFVYHITFPDNGGKESPILGKISIVFSTETGQGSFSAKYDPSGECSGCKEVEDGLDVYIPLSRHPIGAGRLIVTITFEIPGEGFPEGVRYSSTKVTTNVFLWDGPSDGSVSINGSVVL